MYKNLINNVTRMVRKVLEYSEWSRSTALTVATVIFLVQNFWTENTSGSALEPID